MPSFRRAAERPAVPQQISMDEAEDIVRQKDIGRNGSMSVLVMSSISETNLGIGNCCGSIGNNGTTAAGAKVDSASSGNCNLILYAPTAPTAAKVFSAVAGATVCQGLEVFLGHEM